MKLQGTTGTVSSDGVSATSQCQRDFITEHSSTLYASVRRCCSTHKFTPYRRVAYIRIIYKQETHLETRIPELDVMYIVLSLYLLTLIHR